MLKVVCWLNPDDKEKLDTMARKANLSRSAFMRKEMFVRHKPLFADRDVLLELTKKVADLQVAFHFFDKNARGMLRGHTELWAVRAADAVEKLEILTTELTDFVHALKTEDGRWLKSV